MEKPINENIVKESTKQTEKVRFGFEVSREQAENISAELSKFNDAIIRDKPVKFEDVENLDKLARNTKIDVGGEIMTVEEAEEISDLKMNAEIWKEISEGDFKNSKKLTRITPHVSNYFKYQQYIDLGNLKSAKGLVLPRSVAGNLDLRNLTSPEELVLPESVGGDLHIGNLISANGLKLPQTIGRSLYLGGLTSADCLVFPNSVGGNLDLYNLVSGRGLKLPSTVASDLGLDNLTTAEGLVFPEIVKGNIILPVLRSAMGLELPHTVWGDLYLNSLVSIDGLILPTTVGGSIVLPKISSADKQKLRDEYPNLVIQ